MDFLKNAELNKTECAVPAAVIEAGAVESLFRKHNRALVRFLSARLRSEQDALEVAQEVYIRLLRRGRVEELGYMRAYMFKIAANLAVDHMRSTGRRGDVVIGLPEYFDVPVEATQEASVDAKQQLCLVNQAVEELPAKCRQAFCLSREEEWSAARIAEHMELSDRMIRNYLSRAVEHIRGRLGEV